jgi:TP901 family phage tail tape measure protein
MPGTEIDGGQIKGTLILDGKKFSATLVKAGVASNVFTKKQVKNARVVSTAWKLAFAAIGVSALILVKRGFSAVIEAGSELEKSLANVSTLGDISAETMAQMEAQVKSLSSELRKQPVDLTEGLYQAISAGAKAGSEAIDVLTESAKFANAGLTDTKTAVNAITNAMNAYGKENLSANRAANLMFKTIQLGKTTAEELAPQLGRVISRAESLGVTFEQVSAASALLTRTMPTPLAITSLEGAFRGLTDASDEFEQAGIDIFEVLKEEGLGGALQRLQELTGGNIEEIKKFITDGRALRGILSLLKNDVKSYNNLLEQMKEQTDVVTDAVGKQMDTTASRTKGLKSAFTLLAASIFDDLQPAYDNFLIVATKVLDVSNKLIGAGEKQAELNDQELAFQDILKDATDAEIISKEEALNQMDSFRKAIRLNNALRGESEESAAKNAEAIITAEEEKAEAARVLAQRQEEEEKAQRERSLAAAQALVEEKEAQEISLFEATKLQIEKEEDIRQRQREAQLALDQELLDQTEAAELESFDKRISMIQAFEERKKQQQDARTALILEEQQQREGLDIETAERSQKALQFQKDLSTSVQGFIAKGWANTAANYLANSDKMIASGTRWRDVMDGVWDSMKEKAISTLLNIVTQQIIQAGIVATGWAPAAALSAIGTGGASAGAAEIAIASVFSSIGKFIPKRQEGGPVSQGLTFTHDDEFVLSRLQTGQVSQLLTTLNDRLDKLETQTPVIKVGGKSGLASALINMLTFEVEVNGRRLIASGTV